MNTHSSSISSISSIQLVHPVASWIEESSSSSWNDVHVHLHDEIFHTVSYLREQYESAPTRALIVVLGAYSTLRTTMHDINSYIAVDIIEDIISNRY